MRGGTASPIADSNGVQPRINANSRERSPPFRPRSILTPAGAAFVWAPRVDSGCGTGTTETDAVVRESVKGRVKGEAGDGEWTLPIPVDF